VPRAWRLHNGQWTALPGPAGDTALRGEMTGVAAGAAGGLVAVGWVAPRTAPEVTARRPAIWTSADATNWTLLPAPAAPAPVKLGELSDVAARPGGGYVASGVDWGTDPTAGDGAVLTSPDGTRWQRVATRGLDGPGPTTLRRLLPGAGGVTIAVGTRLDGSVSRSVVWTSPDAQTWSAAGTLDAAGPALPSAWGLARTASGALLVTGFSAAPDRTLVPVAWTGTDPASLRPRPVSGATGSVYGVVSLGAALTAVGATASGDGTVAAAWTVGLG
jgi:molecular chaperone DnaK